METLDKFKETKEDIVMAPKDEILAAVIVGIKKGTMREYLIEAEKEDLIKKFNDGVDDVYIFIDFETNYKGIIIKGHDKFKHYSPPMDNSNYGKFLMKYKNVGVGGEIKAHFRSEGFPKIVLE